MNVQFCIDRYRYTAPVLNLFSKKNLPEITHRFELRPNSEPLLNEVGYGTGTWYLSTVMTRRRPLLSAVPLNTSMYRSCLPLCMKCMLTYLNDLFSLDFVPKKGVFKAMFRIRTGFIADPDPAFYLNSDPEPGGQINAGPCGSGSWSDIAKLQSSKNKTKRVLLPVST
jgi:hypothetical protein